MGFASIIIAIVLLWILAYKGWSTLWISPIAAAIVGIFGGMDLLDMYTNTYMTGFANFAMSWFPVFMLGAIFGKLMDETRMAQSIATHVSKWFGSKWAIVAVVIAGSILTYGGISMFVCVFCLYPMCIVLFRDADIPRRLIPATITVGVFEYTMVCLPGTPQIQNLIPTQYFGTTAMAAPVLGIICGIIMGGGGTLYMIWRARQAKKAGEHFTEPTDAVSIDLVNLPNFWISILPLLIVIITLNALHWNIILSLIAANVAVLVLNPQDYKKFVPAINEGAKGAMMPIISVSAINGFGAVVKASPAFTQLVENLNQIPGSPLIAMAVAVNVVCGATGSATGGITITLSALAEQYIKISQETGIPLSVFHRILVIAASGMDTVPHNGAILTLLAVTGMTHKEAYRDIPMCTIILPWIATAVGIFLVSLGMVY